MGYWDLEIRDSADGSGEVTRLMEGIVSLDKEVTRTSEDADMTDWRMLGPYHISGLPSSGFDYFTIPLPFSINIQRVFISSMLAIGVGQIDIRNAAAGGGEGISLTPTLPADGTMEDTTSTLDVSVEDSEKLYIRVVNGGTMSEVDIVLWGKV